MADAFSIKFDTSALESALDGISDQAAKCLRPAAQAGAQVFYDEVLLRVPVSGKDHFFHGKSFKVNGKKYAFESGALKGAVYQAYSADQSGPGLATYNIAWNHQKVPYGFMVEFGTSRAPAHPFLRPSFDAKAGAALQAANDLFTTLMSAALAGSA